MSKNEIRIANIKRECLYRYAHIIECYVKNNYSISATVIETGHHKETVSAALSRFLARPDRNLVFLSKV